MVSKYLFIGIFLQNHNTKETNNSACLSSLNSSLESYNKNEPLLERKSCIQTDFWDNELDARIHWVALKIIYSHFTDFYAF